jgi:TPR repeat protein
MLQHIDLAAVAATLYPRKRQGKIKSAKMSQKINCKPLGVRKDKAEAIRWYRRAQAADWPAADGLQRLRA